MGTRHERVVLTLEDNLSGGMARAAAQTEALNQSLARLDGSNRDSSTSLQRTAKQVKSLGDTTRKSSVDLDSYSNRLGLLGTSALALGPSILPIAAAGVPALASLTAGMAAASIGAAALILAFNGVGDAVSAVSDYKLEPTAENLEKVRVALEELGPAGASFVMALDEMRPALDDLQAAARDGIFPGFETGLRELATRLPGIRDLVSDVSEAIGRLGAGAGQSLANDADWQEFFDFLGNNAAQDLEDFGRATGNFIAGTASLVEALGSLRGADSGLLDMSRSFREWAAGIEQTEGWKDFAEYVRESGPQVTELLKATGEAIVALAEAMAPWGQVVVPVLTAAAKAFAAIAGSPIGPPLFIAATALLAVSKATALLGPNLTKASASIRGLGSDLRLLSGGLTTFSWERTASQTAAFGAAAERTRSRVASLARGVAAATPQIAAFAALSTGAAEKAGLTNTATLALAGSMAGPWGTAAGTAVGLTMDLAHANDDLQAAIKGANAAMGAGDLERMNAELETLRDTLKETTDSNDLGFEFGSFFGAVGGLANLVTPGVSLKKVMADLSGDTEEATQKLQELGAQRAALEDLAVTLGANRDSAAEMASGADRAQVAMKALGISSADLAAAQQMGSVEFDLLSGRIQDWVHNSESAASSTDAVGDAVANLANDAISAADSASALASALDALISPEQNLIAAQDQLTTSIRHLGDDLDKQNKTLQGNSDAAIKNRGAISDRVTELQKMIAAEAEAGRGPEVVANSLAKQRRALIDSAVAAGANRKQVERLVNQMNLTPELVKTVFENAGINESEQKARNLRDAYNRLPKDVRTDIKTNGVPKSEAAMKRLQRTYGLTPDEVRTIAALRDNASVKIKGVKAELASLDGRTATTTVTNRIITERITISRGQSTRTDRRLEPGQVSANGSFQENGIRAFADGGYGSDGRYYSRQPMLVSGGKNILWGEKETGWEAYISGKPSERDRNLQILGMAADRLGASVTAFASGGVAGHRDPVAAALWQSGHRDPRAGLIADLTVRQLTRLGRAFDDLSDKRLKRFERSMERAINVQEKQTDKARERFEKVRDRRNELGASITEGLRGDLFADAGGSAFGKQFAAGSIGAVNAQLRSERDQAKQFSRDIATLRKKGLNGAALEEIIASGDASRARMFASGSVSALRSYEAAYNARQSATAAAGRLGGQVLTPEFGALKSELNKQIRELGAIKGQLVALRKEQRGQHDSAQKSRKDNGSGPAARKAARGRG